MTRRNLDAVTTEALQRELVEIESRYAESARAKYADPMQLICDLERHEIELELQNRELRSTQIELEAARERFADLYESAPIPYCTIDRRGRIVGINQTGTAFFDLPKPLIVDRPFIGLRNTAARRRFHEHIEACLVNGRAETELELTVAHRDACVRLVSTSVESLEDDSTEIRTAIFDVTQTRVAEERLRFLAELGDALGGSLDSRETLRAIVGRTVPFLADVCFVDIVQSDGTTERPFVHANREGTELAELFRQAHTAVGSRSAQASVIASRKPLVRAQLTADEASAIGALVAPFDSPSVMVVPLVARNRALGALTLVAAHSRGSFTSADVAFAENVAQRAALAIDNARLHERARRDSFMRERVLASVAHELRSPLAVVLTYAAMLLKGRDAEQKAMAVDPRRAMEAVQRSAKRMVRLIDDILDAASIEAGRLSLTIERVPASSLAREALDCVTAPATRKGIAVRVHADQDLDVSCDRDRIIQVLTNLLGNAIKFSSDGSPVELRIIRRGHLAVFEVRDHGPGIPEPSQQHVFDRFWQARDTQKLGTGLGLAIAKGIIESHQGRIWLESAVGRGTTFFFTLSIASGQPSLATGTPRARPSEAVAS